MRIKSFIYIFLLSLFLTVGVNAQRINKISSLCAGSRFLVSQIVAKSDGSLYYNPCAGQSSIFTETVDFSGATVILPSTTSFTNISFTGWARGGNGTAGTPTYSFTSSPTTGVYRSAADTFAISTAGVLNTSFSAATNLFVSPIQTFTSSTSANHRTALWTLDNAAGNGEFVGTFTTGAAGLGSFVLGDNTGAARTNLSLVNSTSTANLQAAIVGVGDVSVLGNGTALNLVDSTKTFSPVATGSTAIWDDAGVVDHKLNRTITAAGTTGNQTINKQAGTVNIAAAGTSIVITNNTVTTSSIVTTTIRTLDATCTSVKAAVPTANTITITMVAACTAETSIGFIVWN